MVNIKKEDQEEMAQSMNESAADAPLVNGAGETAPWDEKRKQQEGTELAVPPRKGGAIVVPNKGIDIEGLQDIPMAMLAVPFVKMVQPTSINVEQTNGQDAPPGTFYFTDLQEAFEDLSIYLLRAKYQVVDIERDGVFTPTKQVMILGITQDTNKLFILTLSVTSFSNFGKLMSKFKAQNALFSWQYGIKVTSAKQENKKGKYWVAEFQLMDEITEDQQKELGEKYSEYGGVLERQDIQDLTVE